MKTPLTDAIETQCNRMPIIMAFLRMRDHAREIERQRHISVTALQDLAAQYGHRSDPDCKCDDCNHIRAIETAIHDATQTMP